METSEQSNIHEVHAVVPAENHHIVNAMRKAAGGLVGANVEVIATPDSGYNDRKAAIAKTVAWNENQGGLVALGRARAEATLNENTGAIVEVTNLESVNDEFTNRVAELAVVDTAPELSVITDPVKKARYAEASALRASHVYGDEKRKLDDRQSDEAQSLDSNRMQSMFQADRMKQTAEALKDLQLATRPNPDSEFLNK